MTFNTLVFDIETVPDVEGARRLWDLEGLSDEDAAKFMFAKRQQETDGQSDFLRHHLQKVCAIAAVFRHEDRMTVWSLGDEDATEAEILRRFFEGIERYSPTLVSWNGGGFDLPVLQYRALINGVSAPRYWEIGNDEASFRYNNYLGRFHWRHLDLMDVLSGYQPRAAAKLDEMASLMGFPGKLGMSGADVWPRYLAGELPAIRAYCETDALNTYLLYLAFERMRGNLLEDGYREELSRLRVYLAEQNKTHFVA
ncbi:MAG: 3'-5' exonuclease, partial [Gammaproteobacteria bacterium]